jgi:hypothetical protein
MPSPRQFSAPILLKDGRKIATVGDVRELITALPLRQQMTTHWRYTSDLMHEAARRKGGPNDATLAQLRKALKAEGLL